MKIVGDSQPINDVPEWIPAKLRDHFRAHGPGLLAGQIALSVPGTSEHASLCTRFDAARNGPHAPLGWGWLADPAATVIPLGEAMGGRGFLLHVHLLLEGSIRLRPRLWFCHRWGGVFPVGHDVDDLLDVLMAAMLVELETLAIEDPFFPEQAAEALSIEPTYDTRPEPSADALRAALATRDERTIDDAVELFLGWGLPVDRLPLAERIARECGLRFSPATRSSTLSMQ